MADTINGQLNVIIDRIDRVRSDIREIKDDMARKEDVEALRGEFTMVKFDHEERLRRVERCTERAEERQRFTTGVLAALTLIASTIAAWLGIQK